VRRGEVFWVRLDPTEGVEIRKTRPAIIVSNDAANARCSSSFIAMAVSISANGAPRVVFRVSAFVMTALPRRCSRGKPDVSPAPPSHPGRAKSSPARPPGAVAAKAFACNGPEL